MTSPVFCCPDHDAACAEVPVGMRCGACPLRGKLIVGVGGAGVAKAQGDEAERAFDLARVNGNPIFMDFTDHEGFRSLRTVEPRDLRWTYTTEFPEPQWMLIAHDLEANRVREFPLRNIHRYNGDKTTLVGKESDRTSSNSVLTGSTGGVQKDGGTSNERT